jgi:hypothetical protein
MNTEAEKRTMERQRLAGAAKIRVKIETAPRRKWGSIDTFRDKSFNKIFIDCEHVGFLSMECGWQKPWSILDLEERLATRAYGRTKEECALDALQSFERGDIWTQRQKDVREAIRAQQEKDREARREADRVAYEGRKAAEREAARIHRERLSSALNTLQFLLLSDNHFNDTQRENLELIATEVQRIIGSNP